MTEIQWIQENLICCTFWIWQYYGSAMLLAQPFVSDRVKKKKVLHKTRLQTTRGSVSLRKCDYHYEASILALWLLLSQYFRLHISAWQTKGTITNFSITVAYSNIYTLADIGFLRPILILIIGIIYQPFFFFQTQKT